MKIYLQQLHQFDFGIENFIFEWFVWIDVLCKSLNGIYIRKSILKSYCVDKSFV